MKSKKNIDPKITNKIWKSMIQSFIEYEFRNFKNNFIYYAVVVFFQQNIRVYVN